MTERDQPYTPSTAEALARLIDGPAFSVHWEQAHDPRDIEQGRLRREVALRQARVILESPVIEAVRAEEREKARRIAEAARTGDPGRPDDWTPYAQGNNAACDAIAARIEAQGEGKNDA